MLLDLSMLETQVLVVEPGCPHTLPLHMENGSRGVGAYFLSGVTEPLGTDIPNATRSLGMQEWRWRTMDHEG